jgi:peptide/nickel transport system permease protein
MALLGFMIRRAVLGLAVIWLISVAVFAIFYVTPNDVAQTLAGRQATPETVALVRHRLRLDRPITDQYVHFVSRATHGDLGYDYYHGTSVRHTIAEAIPATASLAIGGAILAVLVGTLAGLAAAVRPRSAIDRSLTFICVVSYSTPSFVIGLLLLYVFYFRLTLGGHRWFPPGGYVPLTEDPASWARHLILPWLCLVPVLAAPYARLVRVSMSESLRGEYVKTARAKGLRERRVVVRHALRPALVPVLTQFGIDVGALLGGVVVIETLFGIDGLGRRAVVALNQQDLPVIMGIALVGSVATVVASILVDTVYALLDPRVSLR